MRDAHHLARNRSAWTTWAGTYADQGRRAWATNEPHWGIWGVPEAQLQALPDVAGRDVVELGCGTAYWSAWLARQGARCVGLDPTAAQLASARAFQREFGPEFPLVEASAEAVPLRDESFDLAFSEYGASIWCDPYLWVPEAARLLRPGGELVFMKNATLLVLCMRNFELATPELNLPAVGLHRLEWDDQDGAVNFDLTWGNWIKLFRRCHLAIEDLIEVQVPADGPPSPFGIVPREWASKWPSEEIWRVRKER